MKYLNKPISKVIPGEAIVIAKLNGQILSGNQEALELYNYPSLHSFKSKHLRDLMPDDFAALYPDEMTPEHINFDGYYKHVCKRKSGELFACKLHTHYQNINGKKLLIGHVQKIEGNVDIETLRLQQNVTVLERELKAERKKNHSSHYSEIGQQIIARYPTLSSHDLKLCYLLALNYDSKQIAKELNITIDGVYSARKRIRKKLELGANEDLNTILMSCIKPNKKNLEN